MGKTKTKSRSVGDSPKPPITIRSTNPKILDDNIAKLEKAIQASDVSANPSGTAEETLLSTIGIDGKKYELGPSAENTSYNNTDSGLTATDTQAAIDEISSASGISYDNTDSGLTADDVQSAIDELNTLSSEVINFSNASCDTAYKIRVAKYGKIINMSGMIHPTADIAANSVLTNLVPAGYRPNGSVYSTSTNNVILIADDSGNISLANVSAGLSNGGYYPFNIIFIL